jgi:hypothetical protein
VNKAGACGGDSLIGAPYFAQNMRSGMNVHVSDKHTILLHVSVNKKFYSACLRLYFK